MAGMLKILVVDDMDYYHRRLQRELGARVAVISAYTVEQGREMFVKLKDELAAVVIDACIPGSEPSVLAQELIAEIRDQFKVPVIGISFTEWHFNELKNSGCSVVCLKENLSARLCETLKIEREKPKQESSPKRLWGLLGAKR